MHLDELQADYKKLMLKAAQMVAEFPWKSRASYAAWLAQSYYFVRHSTRLLALASGRASLSRESIHRRMANHLREETGHEKLAELDIQHLGFDRASIPELVPTRLFYQSQYFWIDHHSASAFLGYILFLEGLAATQGPKILQTVQAAHGPASTSFLKVHAEEDQTHIEKAFAALKDLSAEELSAIGENMWNSGSTYEAILQQISQIYDEQTTPTRAAEELWEANKMSI